jgi:hypothetical protein
LPEMRTSHPTLSTARVLQASSSHEHLNRMMTQLSSMKA